MAAIGIASMALGAASSIFGGVKAARAQKKANTIRRNQQQREDAWYQRRYNEHYADTAAGQQLLTAAKDYARDNFQKAQGAAAVGGASTAQAAAAKEAGNKVVGQTLSNMAAQDTARKDRIDAIHHNSQAQSAEQQAQTEENRGAQINAAATQAGNQLIQGGASMLQESVSGSKQAVQPKTGLVETPSQHQDTVARITNAVNTGASPLDDVQPFDSAAELRKRGYV